MSIEQSMREKLQKELDPMKLNIRNEWVEVVLSFSLQDEELQSEWENSEMIYQRKRRKKKRKEQGVAYNPKSQALFFHISPPNI